MCFFFFLPGYGIITYPVKTEEMTRNNWIWPWLLTNKITDISLQNTQKCIGPVTFTSLAILYLHGMFSFTRSQYACADVIFCLQFKGYWIPYPPCYAQCLHTNDNDFMGVGSMVSGHGWLTMTPDPWQWPLIHDPWPLTPYDWPLTLTHDLWPMTL